MSNKGYLDVQEKLIILGMLVDSIDLDAFIERIDQADSAVPFLNSTLWIEAHTKLDDVKKLAEAAKVFQSEFRRQRLAEKHIRHS